MAEQLQRPGYNTRGDVQDQRFDAYFNPDSPVDPNANPVTPTDFSRLEQLFQQQTPQFSFNTPDLMAGNSSADFQNSLINQYGIGTNFASRFNNRDFFQGVGNKEFERLYNTPDEQLSPTYQFLKNNPSMLGDYVSRFGGGYIPEGGGEVSPDYQEGYQALDPLFAPEQYAAWKNAPGVPREWAQAITDRQNEREKEASRTSFFKDAAKFFVTRQLPMIAPMLGPVTAGVSSVANAALNKDPLAALGGLAGIAGGTGLINPSMASGIKSVAGIGNAILKKNPIGAISGGLGLANNSGLQSMFNNTGGGNNMADFMEFDDWGSQSNLGGNNAFPSQNPVDDPLGAYLMENNQQYGDAGLDPNSFYGQQVFSGTPNWASNYGGGAQQNMDGSQGNGGFMNDLFKKGGYLETAGPMVGALGNIFMRNQQNKQLGGLSNQMMQSMDPFGAQRPQYQQALSQTYTNPALYMNSPEHQAIQKRMRDELEKKDAAGGRRSQYGARSVQLQEAALANLFKQREQLGGFAGAQIAPNAQMGANAMLGQQAVGQNQMGSLADIMRGIQDYGKTRNGQPYGMQQQVAPY